MNRIHVRTRMNDEDFKNYLYYHQYYEERYYIPVRTALSFGIGLAAAFFSAEKLTALLIVSLLCLLVFLIFPFCRIRFNYKRIYFRNRSQAFSQSQDFEFAEDFMGFKSEHETEYSYEPYSNLKKVAETKSLYIIAFSKKQTAVVAKREVEADIQKEISNILKNKLGDRFVLIKRI